MRTDATSRPPARSTTLAGEEVEAQFRAEDATSKFRAIYLSTRTLEPVSPSWVEPVLAPGTYRLTLKLEGYAREVREVELRAGLPAAVRVVMRRMP